MEPIYMCDYASHPNEILRLQWKMPIEKSTHPELFGKIVNKLLSKKESISKAAFFAILDIIRYGHKGNILNSLEQGGITTIRNVFENSFKYKNGWDGFLAALEMFEQILRVSPEVRRCILKYWFYIIYPVKKKFLILQNFCARGQFDIPLREPNKQNSYQALKSSQNIYPVLIQDPTLMSKLESCNFDDWLRKLEIIFISSPGTTAEDIAILQRINKRLEPSYIPVNYENHEDLIITIKSQEPNLGYLNLADWQLLGNIPDTNVHFKGDIVVLAENNIQSVILSALNELSVEVGLSENPCKDNLKSVENIDKPRPDNLLLITPDKSSDDEKYETVVEIKPNISSIVKNDAIEKSFDKVSFDKESHKVTEWQAKVKPKEDNSVESLAGKFIESLLNDININMSNQALIRNAWQQNSSSLLNNLVKNLKDEQHNSTCNQSAIADSNENNAVFLNNDWSNMIFNYSESSGSDVSHQSKHFSQTTHTQIPQNKTRTAKSGCKKLGQVEFKCDPTCSIKTSLHGKNHFSMSHMLLDKSHIKQKRFQANAIKSSLSKGQGYFPGDKRPKPFTHCIPNAISCRPVKFHK